MNLITLQPTQVLSSMEIARLTGKRHDHVMRDIQVTLHQAGIDVPKFGGTYEDSQNRIHACFFLPRRECDLVISGYSVKYRLAIIDRWRELEAGQAFQIPQTMSEALRLAADQAETIERQNEQLAIAAPKVEFHDTVTESPDVCQMAVAAQVAKLPFGRNTLFQKLRERGVLISGGERHNLPRQEYIARGLFTVNEKTFRDGQGEPHVTFSTHVTQKGISWLIKTFGGQQAATA
jgi:phage antirepressor YoqD-like protein